MSAQHDKGDPESRLHVETTAHTLIADADPLLQLRCRVSYLLACSDKGDYVHYGEEAVYITEPH